MICLRKPPLCQRRPVRQISWLFNVEKQADQALLDIPRPITRSKVIRRANASARDAIAYIIQATILPTNPPNL
jgi:hypothetical protein